MKWVKPRQPQSSYERSPKQKAAMERIKLAGKAIKVACEGKRGEDWKQCRLDVLQCEFKDRCSTDAKKALDSVKHA